MPGHNGGFNPYRDGNGEFCEPNKAGQPGRSRAGGNGKAVPSLGQALKERYTDPNYGKSAGRRAGDTPEAKASAEAWARNQPASRKEFDRSVKTYAAHTGPDGKARPNTIKIVPNEGITPHAAAKAAVAEWKRTGFSQARVIDKTVGVIHTGTSDASRAAKAKK